ncbi:MAG: competence/damage-inducible protein A [Bacillota bacterium]
MRCELSSKLLKVVFALKAELIFTGTELLLGQILNTNAQYLQLELASLGIDLYYEVTVGDNQQRLIEAIRQAMGRADLIIIGGGLGPTDDDLSRESLAETLGLPLETDPHALVMVKSFFEQRNYSMPESNLKQALVPRGGKALENPLGTAPGLFLEHAGKIFFLLPGPPREIKRMAQDHLIPYVKQKNRDQSSVILSRVLKLCGIGEATVGEKIRDLARSVNPTIAPTAKAGEIHLRITAKAPDETEATHLISGMEAQVRQLLDVNIFGTDDQTIEQVLGDILVSRGLTLSVAESCTGGLLAHCLTNVPGSSRYFQMGVVAYDNRWKTDILGVDPQLIATRGAVSEEVAMAMASGIRRLAKTDIGVGITGIAGPGGGAPEKPVGLVYIATDDRGEVQFWKGLLPGGERTAIKEFTAQTALVLLWRSLRQQ